jgi:hypothetical protein
VAKRRKGPTKEYLAQLDRLMDAFGVADAKDLGPYLDINRYAVSRGARLSRIPQTWLEKALAKKGARPEHILTGRGDKYVLGREEVRFLPDPLPELVKVAQTLTPEQRGRLLTCARMFATGDQFLINTLTGIAKGFEELSGASWILSDPRRNTPATEKTSSSESNVI